VGRPAAPARRRHTRRVIIERSVELQTGRAATSGVTPAPVQRVPVLASDVDFERVLLAARANGQWAWEAIYRAYAPSVLGYLRSQGATSPEDLLGEVFVSVVRDIGRFAGSRDAFRGWLFRIAQNRLIDARRAERRRPVRADHDAGDLPELAAPAREDDGGDDAIALLAVLPDDQRAALYLRFVLDLSQQEVAAILGKRVGAVKMLQRRGQDRLANEIRTRRDLSARRGA
jgi:RNA polymerase sigma-70 factor, ECF subfamily